MNRSLNRMEKIKGDGESLYGRGNVNQLRGVMK
jgi:hypothetical protein